MLDIISDGRLNLGAARGGTAQEMALCGVDPELTVAAGQGGAAVHRPLLARRHDRVGLRAAEDPSARRVARRTPSCRARCSCRTRRCSSRARTRRRSSAPRSTASGRWCSASVGPRRSASMRRMFDEERATRDPDAGGVTRAHQRRVRRAVPDVPDGRPGRGVTRSVPAPCGSSPRRSATGPRRTASPRHTAPTRSTTSRS